MMKKVLGRTDDMMIISGVNVYPSQIESILLDVPQVEPQYVLYIRKRGHLDHLVVSIEAKPEAWAQGKKKLDQVAKVVRDHIHGIIGINIEVSLVEPKTIVRSEGKAKRVIDQRSA